MVLRIPIAFMGDPDVAGDAVRILVFDAYSASGSNRKRTMLPRRHVKQRSPAHQEKPAELKELRRILFNTTLANTSASPLDLQG